MAKAKRKKTNKPIKVRNSVIVLNFNDLHYSIRPPEGRTAEYAVQLNTKLAEVASIAREWSVAAITTTGDLFHRKTEVDHYTVNELMRAMRVLEPWWPIPAIVGNHDSTTGEERKRGIGTLVEAGVIRLVTRQDRVRITNDGIVVEVQGASYEKANLDDVNEYLPDEPSNDAHATLMLTHGNIWNKKQPFPMNRPHVTGEDILHELALQSNDKPVVIVNGHLHMTQPPVSTGQTFHVCNGGSITRTSRGESEHNPVIEMAIFMRDDFGTVKAEVQQYPLLNVIEEEEAFTDKDDTLDAADNEALAEFIEMVRMENDEVNDGSEIIEIYGRLVEQMGVSQSAAERGREYLDVAR